MCTDPFGVQTALIQIPSHRIWGMGGTSLQSTKFSVIKIEVDTNIDLISLKLPGRKCGITSSDRIAANSTRFLAAIY